MSRYEAMFARLQKKREGAFVPFVMLGDPTPKASLEVLDALVAGGADALELGIPFSDPVADGPTIQSAARRALAAGTSVAVAFELLCKFRQKHADIPVGLLVYANLVYARQLPHFYNSAAAAGVDSVLVADVPTLECEPFCNAAKRANVAPVMIAPPNARASDLVEVAKEGRAYTYVVTRRGVTGSGSSLHLPAANCLETLRQHDAPPPVFGFGISTPAHVREALEAGAKGAISGSAVVNVQAACAGSWGALTAFVATMKDATQTARG